jgi:UDP-N-acetylglucosamine 2-epimerase (non-hydrolysing)
VKRLIVIFGTRPEAIKLCPLVLELKKHPKEFHTVTCVTAQHREMLDQVLNLFNVKPDHDLNLMKSNQTLFHITTSVLNQLDAIFKHEQSDMVIVQGDTTTTFAAALAAYYNRISVGHVEAGLRTWDKYAPYPEEMNRKLTTALADIHFAPTNQSKDNLIAEGVPEEKVIITGNTVIDALMMVRSKLINKRKEFDHLSGINFNKRIILVTGHRRESFGQGFIDLCNALKEIALNNPDVEVVYPVHLNPNVRKPVLSILSDLSNVKLIEPMEYEPFVSLLDKSFLVITDSGGIQEEAPALGKPVLVTRDKTERPEALATGAVKLVGTSHKKIVEEAQKILNDQDIYKKMSIVQNPYGDGHACERIIDALSNYFSHCR